ncbi:hypothetical protein JHK85_051747 [Glycine max]|nr:hypothetical protein JHK85_051747 [Glycine max]
MAQTKHALYVDGCDPFHEGLDLSHERDDAGERHQRLIASTHDRQHPPTEEEAIAATIASVGVRLLPVQANGGVEGHDTLPMQGPSLFGFWDRLTAVLKVTVLCHARAFFVRFFFHFGFNIALDGKKV